MVLLNENGIMFLMLELQIVLIFFANERLLPVTNTVSAFAASPDNFSNLCDCHFLYPYCHWIVIVMLNLNVMLGWARDRLKKNKKNQKNQKNKKQIQNKIGSIETAKKFTNKS